MSIGFTKMIAFFKEKLPVYPTFIRSLMNFSSMQNDIKIKDNSMDTIRVDIDL